MINLECICLQINCTIQYFFLNIKSHQMSCDTGQTSGSLRNILLWSLISFVGKLLMCFVFPWWSRRTAHKTIMKALKGRRGTRIVRVLSVSAILAHGGVTQPDVHPENVSIPPIISGILRPVKIGLASKRDDIQNDKTPVSVCQACSLSDWHLLAQAHPGSGEARDKSQTQMAFSLAVLSSTRFRRGTKYFQILILFSPILRNIIEFSHTAMLFVTCSGVFNSLSVLTQPTGD